MGSPAARALPRAAQKRFQHHWGHGHATQARSMINPSIIRHLSLENRSLNTDALMDSESVSV